MAKNDMDDFSYSSRMEKEGKAWDYFGAGATKNNETVVRRNSGNGREKKYTGKLIGLLCSFWIPTLIVIGILYLVGGDSVGRAKEYVLDPFIKFIIILLFGVDILFSVIIVLLWKKYSRVRNYYESKLNDYDWNLPKNRFTKILPITFDGQFIRINRTFKIEEININDVLWINRYYTHAQYNSKQLAVTVFDDRGKKFSAASSGKNNMQSMIRILENIKSAKPDMLYSEGFLSKESRACKAQYKEMLAKSKTK